jgi:bla regulator protein blaR1
MMARATSSVAGRLLNHLWQSTLLALVIGCLTLFFRRNDARVRYWMWFAAAVKFLVPFSLLDAAGASLLGPSVGTLLRVSDTSSLAPASVPFTIAQISQPFTAAAITAGSTALRSAGSIDWMPIVLLLGWAFGVEFVVVQRLRAWRVVRAAVRASTPATFASAHLPAGTAIRSSQAVLEPAVVGMWRPILLLPSGIDERLTPDELDAVIAHEACHISSRDNLTAGIQMLVECLVWFHPLVWWIGARLIQERERACDEHVLSLLRSPRVYADSIVNVCKLYVGVPLPCAPGVSSSDLRQRIERIMRNETGEAVARQTRIALGIAGSLIVIGPIAIGAVTAPVPATARQTPRPPTPAVAFEAVSVKPNIAGGMFARVDERSPGRFTAINVPVALLVRFAYGLEDFEVAGGPRWLETDRYDVVASAGGEATTDQKRAMLRQVLQDRFKLAAHTERRELPTYALLMARNDGRFGPGLHRSTVNCGSDAQSALGPDASTLRWIGSDSPAWAGIPSCGFFGPSPDTNLPAGRGGLSFRGLTMGSFAKTVARLVHRSVTDETKLTGSFDGDFGFIEELPPPPPPPGAPNTLTSPFLSIFTVLPEQLGLKLQPSRGPVNVLVIDAVERPTPD